MDNPNNMIYAADAADALIVLRRARTIAALALIAMLLGQITLFFILRYRTPSAPPAPAPAAAPIVATIVPAETRPTTEPATNPATAPVIAPVAPAVSAPAESLRRQAARYAVGLSQFVGLIAAGVLVLALTGSMLVMVTSRALGTADVVRGLTLAFVVLLLVFPWQAFLNPALSGTEFRVPGVMYHWTEVADPRYGARFDAGLAANVLRWLRYLVFPAATVGVVFFALSRSGRGFGQALGGKSPAAENQNA